MRRVMGSDLATEARVDVSMELRLDTDAGLWVAIRKIPYQHRLGAKAYRLKDAIEHNGRRTAVIEIVRE